jgi:hypothetical protein
MTQEKYIFLHNKEKGISLLVVLLVGSIMFVAAVGVGMLALNALRSSDTRAVSLKTQYAVQDAFACIKRHIDQKHDIFDTGKDESGDFITCNDEEIQGFNTDDVDNNRISTFAIAYGDGGIDVSIERDTTLNHFKGAITLSAFSGTTDNPKTVGRKQKYEYEGFRGADIMFAIDRSGSIGGLREEGRYDGEWGQLVSALTNSIAWLKNQVPEPFVGVVSFGFELGEETGVLGSDAPFCEITDPVTGDSWVQDCVVYPDIRLTSVQDHYEDLPQNNGTPYPSDDSLEGMKTASSNTNISLGLALAGAELMKVYYPYGIAPETPGYSLGQTTGGFETLVEQDADLSENLTLIPETNSSERNDREFPDYIILITDGAPNSFLRTTTDPVSCGNINVAVGGLGYIASRQTDEIGQAILFHVDNDDTGCITSDIYYDLCGDSAGGLKPMTYFSDGGGNAYPRQAMCNATRMARALEDEGVKIAVIGVGVDDTNGDWLENVLASKDASDLPLYYNAENYLHVEEAIKFLLGKFNLVQSL